MTPQISVIVGTFGDEAQWGTLAQRALASVERQTVAPHDVAWVHADSLRDARNSGVAQTSGTHLLFLDADDELDPSFVGAMSEAVESAEAEGHPHLVRPATLGIRSDGVEDVSSVVLPERDLMTGNFMVIATVLQRDLFERVGGFEDWPIYEDWDLWIRCVKAGARFGSAPQAVYRVHVREDSRNQQHREMQVRTFNAIRRQHRTASVNRPNRRRRR